MRKNFIRILGMLCITLFIVGAMYPNTLVASANSGPIKGEPSDARGMLAVTDEDIAVVSEELTFDMRVEREDNYYYELPLDIEAKYVFRNNGEDKTVRMGFPMFATPWSLPPQVTMATEGAVATPIEYTLAYCTYADATAELSLADTLSLAVTDNYYSSHEQNGKLYTFDLAGYDDKNFSVCFRKSENTDVVALGSVHGGNREEIRKSTDVRVELCASTYNAQHSSSRRFMYLMVLGDDISELQVFTSDTSFPKERDRRYVTSPSFTTQTLSLYDFTQLMCDSMTYDYIEGSDAFAQTETCRNIVSYGLHNYLQSDSSFVYMGDSIMYEALSKQLVIALYDVPMVHGEDVTVSVAYSSTTGFDNSFEPSKFIVDYISNPAKLWASFGTLTVRVLPPVENSFVIDSNIPFTRGEDGVYTAVMNGLPEENISFAVCAVESPQRATWSAQGIAKNLKYFFIYGWPFLLVIAVVAVVIIIIVRRKKRA